MRAFLLSFVFALATAPAVRAQGADATQPLPGVTLPPALDRVLRD